MHAPGTRINYKRFCKFQLNWSIESLITLARVAPYTNQLNSVWGSLYRRTRTEDEEGMQAGKSSHYRDCAFVSSRDLNLMELQSLHYNRHPLTGNQEEDVDN